MSTQASDRLPLGLTEGQVVMEIGFDSDCDDAIRDAFATAIGGELLDEDSDEIVEAVLLWWRDDDGDLIDGMVDSLTDLSDQGVIWLMTPKVGRPGYVDAADVAEAAITAGLTLTSTAAVSADWAASKLVRPKSARR